MILENRFLSWPSASVHGSCLCLWSSSFQLLTGMSIGGSRVVPKHPSHLLSSVGDSLVGLVNW